MVVPEFDKRQARKALGLPEEASVVLWLGRLSVYTKPGHGPFTQSWIV